VADRLTVRPQAETRQLSDIDEFSTTEDSEVVEIPASVPCSYAPSTYRQNAYTRQVSIVTGTMNKQTFTNWQNQSEISLLTELPDKRVMSVSVSVSKPPAISVFRSQDLVPQQSSPEKSGHILSDLPDFTMHEDDKIQPSEQALARRVANNAVEVADDRYAMAVQTMVKTLTDVEPEEPFWEDVKKLDLGRRDLASLYGLDEFCNRVQDLDISGNSISQLEGAPQSLRWLDASSNCLNSLTAWGHLMNLHYLDVSDNQLECLDGLENLIHLRELRADNNKISLLYGVLELDGLLKLSVRGNDLSFVDFEECQL